MSNYEDLYSDCPEEDSMCDTYKDDAILCDNMQDAIRLNKLGFSRFLPTKYIDQINGDINEEDLNNA